MKKRISDWVINLDPELSVNVASSQVTNRKRSSSSTALKRYPSNSKRKKATPITRKTSQSNITPLPVNGDSETVWNVKYAPKSTSDLAVHKKKVTEVQQWLEVALSHRTQRPILLLTGPSGCGKTATVHALSHELGVSIVEWSNPLDVSPVGVVDRQAQTRDYEFQESQTKQFLNFLIRGNKYPSLQFSLSSHSELKEDRERGGRGGGEERKSKIVLIEDFPNAILRDPSQLHHLLRNMKRFSYPLIFIVSDSQSSGSSRLFPSLITSELDIYNINFNPVAHTNMVKALQRITETEFKLKTGSDGRASKTTPTTIPNKEMIESIAEKSNGDIRFAVNMLQFSCLRGDKCKSSDNSGEVGAIKRVGPSEQGGVEGRDSSMFLFRALGKILYCKRGNIEGVVDSTSSQASLRSTETRGKLLIEPEAIFESVNMRSELFCLYLHQNYLDFFEKIEDVAVALEYLSDSDVLSSIWTDSQVDRRCLESCSSSVCCRGLLYANTEVSTSKWRPLHKPQWNQVWRKFEDNCATARGLFLHLGASPHSHLWLPVELQTEILPFISLLNKPLRNINQANLLHAVTDFRQTFKRQSSKLGETDFGDETSHAYSLSQTPSIEKQLHGSESESKSTVTGSQLSGTITSDQEEINDIEDFDDDDKW